MRDDFTKATKELLAKRVCYRCSNPYCRKPTSGPNSDSNKALIDGVAAHICAASELGKRYDENMSSEERKSIDNAIWLCENCHKKVDNDDKYTISMLREWKITAENQARKEMLTPEMNTDCFSDTEINDNNLKIKSGKDLKENFYDLIKQYNVNGFLKCDMRAYPMNLNDMINIDCFFVKANDLIEQCEYSTNNLVTKKSYESIKQFVYILNKYSYLLGVLCYPHPQTSNIRLDDSKLNYFNEIHIITCKTLDSILYAIKEKQSVSTGTISDWVNQINELESLYA